MADRCISGGKGNPDGPPNILDWNIPPKGLVKKGSSNGSLPPKKLDIKPGPKEPWPPKPPKGAPKSEKGSLPPPGPPRPCILLFKL
ncbi:hypothetical protein TSUD_185220 [Trifolium subterraneum]|uniref:Uncharacterized protein n=1 Tax=Trifolium subterraneum TaxID=3900 RepID=A0A2Z6PK37_TRISU|nr:hypothetical protein TSUD_185220 [Trifolium subterraneum]